MIKDESGNKYGRLLVVNFAGSISGKAAWNCACECGNLKVVTGDSLRRGRSTSCGCLQRESRHFHTATHKMSKTPTYRSWQEMKARCSYSTAISYQNYGARGISVCKRWVSFEIFLKDMGVRPNGTSLERLNNEKGYSKSNCVWATRKEQNRNKRSNIKIRYKNQTKCLSEWCEELGLAYPRTYHRLSKGWSPAKAFETPFIKHIDRKR